MTKNILVPLDGSRLAEMALPHAVALARVNSFGIVLLRVAPPPIYANSTSWAFAPSATVFEGWEDEVKTEAEYLEALAARLRKEAVNVEIKLLEDDPAAAVVAFVERNKEIALVVMSTHGRSGLSRWLFGSVAEKVLHAAPVPLLMIRSKESDQLPEKLNVPAYRSILVPLDGSELAAQALEQAEVLARTFNATITLVEAVPETPIYGELVPPPALPAEWGDREKEVATYLQQTAKRLQDQGFSVRTQLEYGPPADAILQVSDMVHPDLIVMATHGRSGLPRLWLGSVAMKVVQASSRPVLLVRPRHAASQLTPSRDQEKLTV